MNSAQLLSEFDEVAEAPGGVDRLRGLVLDLAAQGKLLAQDPDDEPASQLLRQIADEVPRLWAKGYGKKTRTAPAVDEDEQPFTLPTSWRWTRLQNLTCYIQRGKGPKYTDRSPVPVVSQKCVQWSGFTLERARFVQVDSLSKYGPERYLRNGDLLWNSTGTGTVGRINVFPGSTFAQVVADSHVTVIRPVLVEPQFIWLWLASGYVQGKIGEMTTGTTKQQELGTRTVRNQLVPLAPHAEQRRIVARVDELMELCDGLETKQSRGSKVALSLSPSCFAPLTKAESRGERRVAWHRVSTNFDDLTSRPGQIPALRQAILKLAVRGRLVEQVPQDEPATKLLGKIAAELRDKPPLSRRRRKPIPKSRLGPFQLPSGWEWTRFSQVGRFGRGKSKHRPRNDLVLYREGTYPFVQTGDVAQANRVVRTFNQRYNDVGLGQSRLWPAGTLCITIAANIAKGAILGFDACFPDSVVGLEPTQAIGDTRYFLFFLETARQDLEAFAPATAQKNINLGILEQVLIPLPPLAEIRRIVERVDELMSLCDDLERRLASQELVAERLAEALTAAVDLETR